MVIVAPVIQILKKIQISKISETFEVADK